VGWRKAACTHTGFLPESDPAPDVEIFTRTGLPLPVASTDHARGQSDVERRTGQTCQTCKFQCSYMETDKPPACPPAKHPACRVQVRRANLSDRQLGGPCADRLRVNTPIYLHCIQRRSRTPLRFCRCVCANALKLRPLAGFCPFVTCMLPNQLRVT
jgi:hypothetical protein